MQRNQRYFFRNVILTLFLTCFMITGAQAAKPLWTFTPQTPTNATVTQGSIMQIIYIVTNQSSRPKTLFMKLIPGITQSASCQLAPKGSCVLTLNLNGSNFQGDVVGGPVLCEQGNALQCYQPSQANILRIHLQQPPVQQFVITPLATAGGSISPSIAQVVNAGNSLTFTATPIAGFGVSHWLLDGNIVQIGGTTFQLNTIQANHTVEVTFGQSTLSPLSQNLSLSIKSPGSDTPLIGNPRIIRIQNTGVAPATNVVVEATAFPAGTMITGNTCTGTLNSGATCDVTITPGSVASPDMAGNSCTTAPGSVPVPTVVSVSADNALPTDVNVLVLGYGCITQGGYLFSVDDTTPVTTSIGGKVAALADEPITLSWATALNNTLADSITNGFANTAALATPAGQYPAAQECLNKVDQGFTDWYLPAICETGRYTGIGTDAGCGTGFPNLYNTLKVAGLGNFLGFIYWSSTEFPGVPVTFAFTQFFVNGTQTFDNKLISFRVRCIRAFT